MEVLIVSKTKTNKGNSRCIGGIVLNDNRSVRLEQKNGTYWPANCVFSIGQVWDLTFVDRKNIQRPFIEDVLVQSGKHIRDIDPLKPHLLSLRHALPDRFWDGPLNSTYDRVVDFQVTNGRAYTEVGNEPTASTGFWIPNQDLILMQDRKHYQCNLQQLVYVGENEPLDKITAGTLCRLSLARPIPPHRDYVGPDRSYVQLSGWYL